MNSELEKEQRTTKAIQYLTLCSVLVISYAYYFNYITSILFLGILTVISTTLSCLSRRKEYGTSLILCLIFSYCTSKIFLGDNYHLQLYLYFTSLCIHHSAEYFFVLNYHYDLLCFSSFLIDQSKYWVIAISFSILECFIENHFFHSMKQNCVIMLIGVLCLMTGHIFRIGALFTGKTNFTHLISYEKEPEHVLVTKGIYSISRHPSYFGFYIWSVGTQIMCLNPISTIGFTLANFVFFKDRILAEEELLIEFFGKPYIDYMNTVPILIPFIQLKKELQKAAFRRHEITEYNKRFERKKVI